MRLRGALLLALLGCGCSKAAGSCPEGTALRGGRCLVSCSPAVGCAIGEMCVDSVCVAGQAPDAGHGQDDAATPVDSGAPDLGSAKDAEDRGDAPSAPDAGPTDAIDPIDGGVVRLDVGMPMNDGGTPADDGGTPVGDGGSMEPDGGLPSLSYPVAIISGGALGFATYDTAQGFVASMLPTVVFPSGVIDGQPYWVRDLLAFHWEDPSQPGSDQISVYDTSTGALPYSRAGLDPEYTRTGTSATLSGVDVSNDPCIFGVDPILGFGSCQRVPERAHHPRRSSHGVVAYLNGAPGSANNLEFLDSAGSPRVIASSAVYDFVWDPSTADLIAIQQGVGGLCQIVITQARTNPVLRRQLSGVPCASHFSMSPNGQHLLLAIPDIQGGQTVYDVPWPQPLVGPVSPGWQVGSSNWPVSDLDWTPDSRYYAFVDVDANTQLGRVWGGPAGSTAGLLWTATQRGDPHITFRQP